MEIYTNTTEHGGTFGPRIESLLEYCQAVTIATGYTSQSALQLHRPNLIRVADNLGDVNLLVGMARYEGLAKSTYVELCEIHKELKSRNPDTGGVRIVWEPHRFHGKIYRIRQDMKDVFLAGSSNFSHTGLNDNLEFNYEITDSVAKLQTSEYLEWLLADPQSKDILDILNFPIREYARTPLKRLREALTSPPEPTKDYVDIPLRVDQQPISGLNAFFGRGRLQSTTGLVTPRHWEEIEVIVDRVTRSNPVYPRGKFKAITGDGHEILCQTQSPSNGYKNLRSQNDLRRLGFWLKGKMQEAGVLREFEVITSKTLADYGRDYIRLYKISDGVYRMDF